ncbi:MAG: helix-turn-helix domain-containing protein [Rhodobacteraceae bacterium]|nr:helix-turn-helix domain-containing protein [Paracoccaceae bacterium]MBL4812859.1 helix-turn-helix domain-containing protein [Paracoccaceae bacterium]
MAKVNVTTLTSQKSGAEKSSAPLAGATEVSANRCRTNSRHGIIDPNRRSYPPVEAVCKAFSVLRAVNKLHIATINAIFAETEIPKSTIVRMLETLMVEGYVVRDNMCGGYRVTSRTQELNSGYEGISRVIEIARPLAIGMTRRNKWPIGLGAIDGDTINIHFWTGAISPWAHTSTVLGLRPDLQSTAMGRAYLAFCTSDQREEHLTKFRADPERNFDEAEEYRFRILLKHIREMGYATRDPRTKPFRTTTLAMPVFENDNLQALISISYYKTAVPHGKQQEGIIVPLRNITTSIEDSLSFTDADRNLMPPIDTESFEEGF